ncbi:MAG: hemerythrin domain-containing protein [Burkholderiaceae bacterium]|nr:hemerythrin domain-containing protein [Burkholderiaceae bacterium]
MQDHPDFEPADTPDTLTWSDAFLLGFGPMDSIHEEFVQLVGRLQTAPDAELPALLDAFADHAQRHFDEENTWMEQTEFPARECHIDEHAAVMKSVQEVRALLAQGDVDICRDLANELARWFPGHADYLDSALSHWMCQKRLGGKPVVIRRNVAS